MPQVATEGGAYKCLNGERGGVEELLLLLVHMWSGGGDCRDVNSVELYLELALSQLTRRDGSLESPTSVLTLETMRHGVYI
ncbi:hypothetical protein Taro_016227 [Colocasia esculenta]|uniref:Uncharacterized protein n=1 Tax=Colocasia esculenta TaxID=4460 RepID=A0A843UN88_COLES|nr:hypothetical protein [Colocasia esculenta]